MKYSPTLIAQTIVILMGAAVLSVLVILLPELAREEAAQNPQVATSNYAYFTGAWIVSVPIFVALHQAFKLIGFVNRGQIFSGESTKALQNIKLCTIIFDALILLGVITVVMVAKMADPQEDVTPVITIGFVLVFTSSIIATSTAILQRLLQNAIDIKSENDLIV